LALAKIALTDSAISGPIPRSEERKKVRSGWVEGGRRASEGREDEEVQN